MDGYIKLQAYDQTMKNNCGDVARYESSFIVINDFCGLHLYRLYRHVDRCRFTVGKCDQF